MPNPARPVTLSTPSGRTVRAPTNDWGDTALAFAMRHKNYGIAKMVSSAEEFAKAAKAPDAFGEAKKSVLAPPEIAEIVEKMRQAQAEGKPTGDLRKALYAAIEQLPSIPRTVLSLHYRDGLQIAEIAEMLDCPQGTVKSHLNRGRNRLKTALADMENHYAEL